MYQTIYVEHKIVLKSQKIIVVYVKFVDENQIRIFGFYIVLSGCE